MWTRTITLARTQLLRFEIVVPLTAFMIPFFVAGPQLLTGSMVNALLFLHAISGIKKNRVLTAILPSIGAVAHGVVFGPNTPFILYFLPFIWLGNFVLLYSYPILQKRLPLPFVILSGSVLKAIILYATANIYYVNSLVPDIFMTTMGMIQLYTAILGGLIALSIWDVTKKYE